VVDVADERLWEKRSEHRDIPRKYAQSSPARMLSIPNDVLPPLQIQTASGFIVISRSAEQVEAGPWIRPWQERFRC
jgi:hypothetical protein